MVTKKPRIVIIGAGMAGLVAAHELYTATASKQLFDLCIVEGGNRIGGRICTTEFKGNKVEMGATWIHGIGGSPVHKIARQIGALHSEQPWERMDGFPEDPVTVSESGLVLRSSLVDPISNLYRNMMDFAKGKTSPCNINGCLRKPVSIGSFLRKGLEDYWLGEVEEEEEEKTDDGYGKWGRKKLEEAVFAMFENTERTYTGAGDLFKLDFRAEHEYQEFPGEEITIAKGYSSIVESLASVFPDGFIHLGTKVTRIEWCPEENFHEFVTRGARPVKLHFEDGSVMEADHVIVTVSLGVLKASIQEEKASMFSPQLPSFKVEAISRLGFGVVNKLFLELGTSSTQEQEFPSLQMAFQHSEQCNQHHIPWWMRRVASTFPIYKNSSIVLSWFAGEEALKLESLQDDEIIEGVSKTISSFLPSVQHSNHHKCSNRFLNSSSNGVQFTSLLKSRWGSNPLFMGSYSYVAVGSSGDDFDSMAKPLPTTSSTKDGSLPFPPPLQILFAGEATHRTHYSTTHGAYLSGIREANRLLQHYNFGG